ncbi:hypothetical protein OAA15_00655 [bacterium]|nr:hypothetical protein [bacterium]
MKTIAQLLKHDFESEGLLRLHDPNGNLIYFEYSNRKWYRYEYDDQNREIYYQNSRGYYAHYEWNEEGEKIHVKGIYDEPKWMYIPLGY